MLKFRESPNLLGGSFFCVRAPGDSLFRRDFLVWAFLCVMLRRRDAPETHHFTVSRCRFSGGRNSPPRRPYGVYNLACGLCGWGGRFRPRMFFLPRRVWDVGGGAIIPDANIAGAKPPPRGTPETNTEREREPRLSTRNHRQAERPKPTPNANQRQDKPKPPPVGTSKTNT